MHPAKITAAAQNVISPRRDWPGLAAGSALAVGTVLVYSRTFDVPLLWDDIGSIAENPTIRHLWPIGPVLSPPPGAGVGGRPLTNLSFAINYAFGGSEVPGYHWVNLLIHVLAGWTLFALVRGTLRRPGLVERFGPAAAALGFAVSALWSWHPVQTEAVTYLTQRSESLMGLFYLLTLYGFLRGAEAPGAGARRVWFAVSFLACLAGMATKEVMVTAPVMVLLYDRTFVSGSFPSALKRHGPLLAALAVTWIPLALLLSGLRLRAAGFEVGVTAWTYALTECSVVVHYFLLALWPRPLIFDHAIEMATGVAAVWPFVLVMVLALAGAIVALARSPRVGFLICWFFVILAPTSSFVPLAGQPLAEHRLYLPLAAIAALAVVGIYAWLGRRCLAGFAILAVMLAAAAAARNRDYRSDLSIWSDTVAKNPINPRAHNNVGNALLNSNSPEDLPRAIAELQESLRLDPAFAKAHNNLGIGWSRVPGHQNDAIAEYEAALRSDPDYAEPHINLGNSWSAVAGRLDSAIAEYQKALALKPYSAEAHYDLGTAWLRVPGRTNDAVAEFRETLRLNPNFTAAHYNLALGLLNTPGGLAEARAHLEAYLRAVPDNASARQMLNAIQAAR